MKPLALLMWLGIVTTAAAQTEHEEMIFRGVGAVTCGEFARQYSIRPDFAELMFLTWAEGYMSARNDLLFTDRKEFRDLNSKSDEEQFAHLRLYCDQHPLSNFVDAVYDLSEQLKTSTKKDVGKPE